MSEILGCWKLQSFESEENGEITYPWGETVGQLIYGSDSTMSVIIQSNLQPFESDGMREGTDSEMIGAYRGTIAYAGKFEIFSDKVVHKIEHSLFPNWIGQNHTRYFKLEDSTLSLTTPEIEVDGKHLVHRLNWIRGEK